MMHRAMQIHEKAVGFVCCNNTLTVYGRFSGKERLPCNCGAVNCRGYVNKAAVQEEVGVQVTRSRLKPYC